MITWSAPIYIYLWLAGMAGGGYFAAFLAERFAGEGDRRLSRLAIYMGALLGTIGAIMLLVDLGNPLRFWHLLTRFKTISPMSLGTWILLAWVGIAVIMGILFRFESYFSERRIRDIQVLNDRLAWLELAVSALLTTYTGVLLAASNRALWAGTFLLPPLFVASSTSTGVAMLIIYALIGTAVSKSNWTGYKLFIKQLTGSTEWAIPSRMVGRLIEAESAIILIELVVLVAYATWLGTSAMAGALEALNLLTVRALAAPFWIGVVLLALLVPLWLDILHRGKELQRKEVWRAVIVSSACVMLGGLILRAVIVVGGQI